MLVIRFFRIGKKNQPSFKIVVTDKRNSARAGRFVEEVGFYNPGTKEKVLRKERLQYWLSKGVQPSPTVYNLLVREGILEGKKIAVHKKSKKAPAVAPADKPAAKPADKMTEAKPLSTEPLSTEAVPQMKEVKPLSSEAPKTE